jgi:hypothetical protein
LFNDEEEEEALGYLPPKLISFLVIFNAGVAGVVDHYAVEPETIRKKGSKLPPPRGSMSDLIGFAYIAETLLNELSIPIRSPMIEVV